MSNGDRGRKNHVCEVPGDVLLPLDTDRGA